MADSPKATLATMKPSLTIGTTAEVVKLVTEDMCPAFDGVIVHRLYSTWSMAHHMELWGCRLSATGSRPASDAPVTSHTGSCEPSGR